MKGIIELAGNTYNYKVTPITFKIFEDLSKKPYTAMGDSFTDMLFFIYAGIKASRKHNDLTYEDFEEVTNDDDAMVSIIRTVSDMMQQQAYMINAINDEFSKKNDVKKKKVK